MLQAKLFSMLRLPSGLMVHLLLLTPVLLLPAVLLLCQAGWLAGL